MEERMRILKLLEDGKINAEEAAKLLEVLKEAEGSERAVIMKGIVKGIGEAMESVSTLMKEVSATVAEKVREKANEATEKIRKTSEAKKGKKK